MVKEGFKLIDKRKYEIMQLLFYEFMLDCSLLFEFFYCKFPFIVIIIKIKSVHVDVVEGFVYILLTTSRGHPEECVKRKDSGTTCNYFLQKCITFTPLNPRVQNSERQL
jgi:hypothetical protein